MIISNGMVAVFLFQDQLSADMYSFVAKEIDYANYFQTVSVLGKCHSKYCILISLLQIIAILALVTITVDTQIT